MISDGQLRWLPRTGIYHPKVWAAVCSIVLKRVVTVEEAMDAMRRIQAESKREGAKT